ncbi:MAG: NADH-quinone oxidoreductase subunit L [Candidatus Bathyarchaeia archaeon]|nr:NADH-quinone oxidoreductase subunit L [Candidatus Bathyarchaeota archaeon]
MSYYIAWLVWLIPAVSSLFVPVIARLSSKARDYFAVAISLISMLLAFSMLFSYHADCDETTYWIPCLGIQAGVYLDPLSILLACLVTFFGFIIAVYSLGYMVGEDGLTRYYFFILLFIGSMTGLVLSDNFLQFFIFWEMVGLCSYSLVSFWYKRPESVRSGAKVLLMTRIGDICLLAGICLLYAYIGSFSFHKIAQDISVIPSSVLMTVALLILGGAIAKSAQLPLHTWLYSAMEAPTSVSALLHSATMVKAGVYLLARFTLLLGPSAATISTWFLIIQWVGVITAFTAATLAISTPDIKGVAAYSTISQIGFMFAALGAAGNALSSGWFAGVLHLLSHAFFQGLDFLLIGGIVHAVKTRDMRLMGGLRDAMPVTFALSLIVTLAKAGLPPMISFFSKELIFQSVIESGNIYAAIILYGSTAITFAYTLRVMFLVYIREKSDYVKESHVHEAPKIMLFPALMLAALCIILGPIAGWISQFMKASIELGFNEILSPSIIILLGVLALGGVPTYFAYCKKPNVLPDLRRTLNPLVNILSHGYFFDFLYERVVAFGALMFSKGLKRLEDCVFMRVPYAFSSAINKLAVSVQGYMEEFFNILPQIFASGITGTAHKTRRYLDALMDNLSNLVARKTVEVSSKARRVHSSSLNAYIAAIIIGFLILAILLMITMLR